MRALRYLWHTFRHPERRDFIDQGLGIEARVARCRSAWEPHLRCCREFQRRVLGEDRRDSLAILGSGRLYDLDTEFLARRFATIECFDADPGARASVERWARVHGAHITFTHLDLTGSLDQWSRDLREGIRGGAISADEVRVVPALQALTPRRLPLRRYSVVLSCNLLSQLALHWKERVEEIFAEELSLRSDSEGRYCSEIDAALAATMLALEQAHRRLLCDWACEKIVLIHDIAWLYYERASSRWQEEEALKEPSFELPGWSEYARDQWLWHIAPQGIEQPGYGSIHDVCARAFMPCGGEEPIGA